MIEPLDGSRGDYHPTRLGDKLNEVIEYLNAIDPKLSSTLTDIDSLSVRLNKTEAEVYGD